MQAYLTGSLAWFYHERRRLKEINRQLQSTDLSQEDREMLIKQQTKLVNYLQTNWSEQLINNPI